jgi:hypothetical protein
LGNFFGRGFVNVLRSPVGCWRLVIVLAGFDAAGGFEFGGEQFDEFGFVDGRKATGEAEDFVDGVAGHVGIVTRGRSGASGRS